MKAVVLCKQVPDTESRIKLSGDGKGFDLEGVKWILNPYCEFAVEEALLLKDAGKLESVTVLGLGPDRIVEALRTALAMGADDAIHVKGEPAFGDSLGTAKGIAGALKDAGYDLILSGCRAIDDDQFAVPVMVAELLNLPHVHIASKIEIDGAVKTWRDVEGGTKLVTEAPAPCVVSFTKTGHEPRYASLPGIMKAKKKPVDVKEFAGADARTTLVATSLPEERQAGKVLTGVENVPELVRLLREEAKVI
ncbi:electron transfer flavoprotein subunit beta/FixA family protein [bacterium]|nr:electron transfer flavoprotein subunit beta/FixA family protein [bacterium]